MRMAGSVPIAFEGCVGAGKTTLTNYFAETLDQRKILEDFGANPFLEDFYAQRSEDSKRGISVDWETEISFVLIHHKQLKEAQASPVPGGALIADFSIEKDLVYAELNLEGREYEVFREVYDYAIGEVGLPDHVVYLDLSVEILQRRIFQRGRPYELEADPQYIKDFNDEMRDYFRSHSGSELHYFQVDDLEVTEDNEKLSEIREVVEEVIA